MAETPPGGNGNGWSMGIKGYLGQVANLTAVALICVMFWRSQDYVWQQAKEDRAMFTREVHVMQQEHERQREALEDLARTVGRLAEEVRTLKEKP